MLLLNSSWLHAPNPPCSQGMGQSSCSSMQQAQHPSSASPPPPRGPRLSSSPCAKLMELSREPGAVPSWRSVLAGLPMAPHPHIGPPEMPPLGVLQRWDVVLAGSRMCRDTAGAPRNSNPGDYGAICMLFCQYPLIFSLSG